jgi:hypothetical protein
MALALRELRKQTSNLRRLVLLTDGYTRNVGMFRAGKAGQKI